MSLSVVAKMIRFVSSVILWTVDDFLNVIVHVWPGGFETCGLFASH